MQKGNDGFSKMRELLFKHQADVDGLKRTALEGYAATLGLDLKKFGKALDDDTHAAAIEADKKAANDAGINGTPSFTIGPYYLSGAQPLAKFKKLVDRALVEPAYVRRLRAATLRSRSRRAVAAPAAPVTLAGRPRRQGHDGRHRPRREERRHGHACTTSGTLTDGKEFDSSRKHGQPFTLRGRQGPRHQGLGCRARRHEGRRTPQAHHPSGSRVR